jgi:lysophospholipase L1-like esterase
MARLLGPDTNGRFVYAVVTGTLRAAAGLTATVYSAATGSTLANIATYDGTGTPGATISGSTLTVDSDSLLPRFWFPSGTDTVWVSVNGGTRIAVNADADARLDTIFSTLARRSVATASGYPVTDNCYAISQGASSARVTVGTSRVPHTVAADCTDLRLVYGNWFNNGVTLTPIHLDVDGTAVVQIKASVEIGSVIYRVTFGGSVTGTMDGGGMLVSDPLPLDIDAGTVIYTRTFLAAGTTGWYYNKYSYVAGGSGGFITTTDLTAPGSAAVADSSFSPQFAPITILGSSLTGLPLPSVIIIGDSIGSGYGDAPGTISHQGRNITTPAIAGGGFIARALHGQIGAVQVAFPGDTVGDFITNQGHFRRMSFASIASTAIVEYGRNDLTTGDPVATIQANLVTLWTMCANRGMRVFQTTITPRTSSTDGWVSAGNQATTGNEANRTALNDWLRAGAPLVSGVATAVGTSGALTAGQTGHPLFGVFEVADLVETARNSGIWKAAAGSRSVSNAAITSSAVTLTSATASFQTSDVGRSVTVAGAGVAGALLTGLIVSRNSATSVNLDTSATTTVSGAALTIGDTYTLDGLHPTPYASVAMAAAIDTTQIV